MSAIALLIIHFVQSRPLAFVALSKVPLGLQFLAGLGIGAAIGLASYLMLPLTARRTSTRKTIDSYSRLDLSGFNPVWFSLAAGIGEELLFRAALQPLAGIWLASFVFLLAHAPIYKFRELSWATLAQAAGVFACSVFLGLVFEYIGLIAAIVVHAAIDIAGLYTVRRALRDATLCSHK